MDGREGFRVCPPQAQGYLTPGLFLGYEVSPTVSLPQRRGVGWENWLSLCTSLSGWILLLPVPFPCQLVTLSTLYTRLSGEFFTLSVQYVKLRPHDLEFPISP